MLPESASLRDCWIDLRDSASSEVWVEKPAAEDERKAVQLEMLSSSPREVELVADEDEE
jgi:SH3-like domain-containing protein